MPAEPPRPAAPPTLPAGVPERATTLLHLAAERLTELDAARGTARRWRVDPDLAVGHLLLPSVIAAANGLAPPDPTPAPRPAPGGGWLCVDLGPDDGPTFERFCAVIDERCAAGDVPPDAEAFAEEAQRWRLPVTPFRGPRPVALRRAVTCDAATAEAATAEAATGEAATRGAARRWGGDGPGPLHGVRVVDLTAMWAGPLATWLLAQVGAEVVKVEAARRPDGLRRGARPARAGAGPGALFVALDHGKHHRALDLDEPADRAAFLDLVAGADVVIDNLSRRVRPNLGIDPESLRAHNPHLLDVSIHAYPAGRREADWVAYGGGVHATGGLAAGPDGRFAPAVLPYPDPLTGLEAFATVLAALRGGTAARLELSLQEAAEAVRPPRPGPAVEPAVLAGWRQRAVARTIERDGCLVLPCPLEAA